MDIKQLFDDEQAVSPVIGVILMVAITVILAAVIGTFVLGLGDQVQSTTPNAQFQIDYDAGGDDFSDEDDAVEVSHSGGDPVERSQISILVGGETAYDGSSGGLQSPFDDGAANDGFDTTISAGQKTTVTDSSTAGGNSIASDDEVQVIYESDDGQSATLASGTVPS